MNGFNDISIDGVASTILSLLGLERDKEMAGAIDEVTENRISHHEKEISCIFSTIFYCKLILIIIIIVQFLIPTD